MKVFFTLNQAFAFTNFLFMTSYNCFKSDPDASKLISSANHTNFRMSKTLNKSFIETMNNIGPKIEPCGTPQTILNIPEFTSLWLTNCYLSAI